VCAGPHSLSNIYFLNLCIKPHSLVLLKLTRDRSLLSATPFFTCQQKLIQDSRCTCNLEARSCNRCGSGKAISITYSECVFVALRLQYANCMHHTAICGLPGSTIFFHIVTNSTTLGGGKVNINVFWFSVQRFILDISRSKNWAKCDNKYIYWSSCAVPVIVRF
jgi:hypothetical protein